AFNHLLGESDVELFATGQRARHYRKGFPQSIDGAPLLLPTPNTTLRSQVDAWLEHHDLQPKIVAEFEDSALMKVFGQAGHGIFMAPSVLSKEVMATYRVQAIGVMDAVKEKFYAISLERRVTHPAVVALCAASRETLFR
ncbi:MAG: hypothetical protein KDB18_08370, partial [Salinibacterium sp.]|nr:hypothetical protein [Salinibacterium sp.]